MKKLLILFILSLSLSQAALVDFEGGVRRIVFDEKMVVSNDLTVRGTISADALAVTGNVSGALVTIQNNSNARVFSDFSTGLLINSPGDGSSAGSLVGIDVNMDGGNITSTPLNISGINIFISKNNTSSGTNLFGVKSSNFSNSNGVNYGLMGHAKNSSKSFGNIGVLGQANSDGHSNVGLLGTAQASGGATNYGGFLQSDVANAGGTNYGVYGTASGASTNYSGYFAGDVKVEGVSTLATANISNGNINVQTITAGSFVISKDSAALIINAGTGTDGVISIRENDVQKWAISNDNTNDSLFITNAGNGLVLATGGDGKFTEDLGVTGSLVVDNGITGTLQTAAQPNITSVGELTSLTTSGVLKIGESFSADDSMALMHRVSTSVPDSHGYRDESEWTVASGGGGYGSFDAAAEYSGASGFGHLHGFQSRQSYQGSNTMSQMVGFWSQNDHTGAGVLADNIGMLILSPTGAGPISNNYAIKIGNSGRGDNNYAIHTTGTAQTVLGGLLTVAGTLTVGADATFSTEVHTVGDAGIGVANPTHRLHVHDATDPQFHLTNTFTGAAAGDGTLIYTSSSTGTMLYFNQENAGHQFYVNGANLAVTIEADQDVLFAGNVKADTFSSSDGSLGITQTETGVTNFDITIKDGLITSFTKN